MKKLSLVAYAVVLSLLSACGGSSEPGTPMGRLEKVADEIAGHENAGYCDRYVDGWRRTIARELDSRDSEIDKFAASLESHGDVTIQQVGPISVISQKAPTVAPSGPDDFDVSWEELYDEYLKIQNLPSEVEWLQLRRTATDILARDSDRVLDYQNFEISRENVSLYKSLLPVSVACVADPNCLVLPLNNAQEGLLRSSPLFASLYLRTLTGSNWDRRHALEILKRNLEIDLKSVTFRPNPAIRRSAPNEITIPLDAGDFSGFESILEGYITPIWSTPWGTVKLEWQSRTDIFRFLVNPLNLSLVQHRERKVLLSKLVRAKTIAHEFGHVVGFRDRYYYVWNYSSCRYHTQSDLSDLMSSSQTGTVHESDWREIFEHYR